jgi:hypothetical protein
MVSAILRKRNQKGKKFKPARAGTVPERRFAARQALPWM